ncbi:MAG: TldD/PmbA family protein [Coriobacteriia bacterium]|nr:TldD/PmbA family protein [Coriobacteriia bacterium]
MRPDPAQARALAERAVETTSADQAEALVMMGSTALTRFAGNRIHQNVAEDNAGIAIRAVVGTRTGVAATNHLDVDGVRDCSTAAVRAAMAAPQDPDFPGLPNPEPITELERRSAATAGFSAEERATAVRAIVDQSASRGLVAAGTVSVSEQAFAIANSNGISAAMPTTFARATVLSTGPDGGTGWASFSDRDVSALAPAALGDEAATLAERSANPGELEPGAYSVVLAPEAVADIVNFLAYAGFSAKAVEEGRSFMSGRLGEKLVSEAISITDDALAAETIGLTFDFEGVPKRVVNLIENGVAVSPVTDSYWSARTGSPNTGHALPAPNSYGPMPLNLEMAPGEETIDGLVAQVDMGVYVTRFHYVNIDEPVPVLLTGMTRDGTFLIENGRLTRPLKSLRFTQSAIAALRDVGGVTRDRKLLGQDAGATHVPGLLLRSFEFTGQTD